MQQGPCLPHCYRRCPMTSTLLVYMSIVYLVACAVYLFSVRTMGTPFFDTLTEEQREIFEGSKKKRGEIFKAGVFVGVVFVVFLGMVFPDSY